MPREPVEAPRDLSRAVIRFGVLLRRHGLPVSLLQVTDAVRALERLDLGDREEVRLGLRTVLVGELVAGLGLGLYGGLIAPVAPHDVLGAGLAGLLLGAMLECSRRGRGR